MNAYRSKNLFVEKRKRFSSFSMPQPHQHISYELYYLANMVGEAHITIEDKVFPLTKGCIVVIDSNIPHQTNYSQSTDYKRFLLEINPDFFKQDIGQIVGMPIDLFFQQYTGVHYLDKDTSSNIENVLTMIYNESIFEEKYYENIVLLRILEIILLIDRNCEQLSFENTLSSKQVKTIRPVVQFIVENLEENLSLESLAGEFHLDKSYLARAFKQYTNQTVHDFINFKRVEMAQRLLRLYPDYSIHDVAMQLGFSNSSYFTKVFKRYSGTTPTNFRKNNYIKKTL